MSEMKHSAEPWRVDGVEIKDGTETAFLQNSQSIGHYIGDMFSAGPHNGKANAERIVACVNFCAGVYIETVTLLNQADHPTLQQICEENQRCRAEVKVLSAELAKNKAAREWIEKWHIRLQVHFERLADNRDWVHDALSELRAIIQSEEKK